MEEQQPPPGAAGSGPVPEDDTASFEDEKKKARKRIQTALQWLTLIGAVVIPAGFSAYHLFWPLCPLDEEASKKYSPAVPRPLPSLSNPPLNAYLAIDASGSTQRDYYDALTDAILRHTGLKLKAGDGASYTLFGDRTWPPPGVQAASNLDAVNDSRWTQLVPPTTFSMYTNFAKLFDGLHAAIQDELEGAVHTDLILVISDGVPDTVGKNWHCPDSPQINYRFIDDKIRRSFSNLIGHTRPASHKILPYLILVGGKAGCTDRIMKQWRHALGEAGLKVRALQISPGGGNIGPSLFDEVFAAAGRSPKVYLEPAESRLEDDEIDHLMAKQAFSAPYRKWSFLAEGEGRVGTAKIIDPASPEGRGLAKFDVEDADDQDRDQEDRRAMVDVGSPGEGSLVSEPRPLRLRFRYMGGKIPRLPELANCRIKLLTGPRIVASTDLPVGRSTGKEKRQDLWRRTCLITVLGILPLLARLGLYVWFAFLPEGTEARARKRLKSGAELLDAILVGMLAVLTVSWMVIVHPLSFVVGGIGGALGILLVTRQERREQHVPWREFLVVVCECVALAITQNL